MTLNKKNLAFLLVMIVLTSLVWMSPKVIWAADPFGSVCLATIGGVWGWAYDPDAETDPICVCIYIDDVYAGQALADGYYPELPQVIPEVQGDYHGFDWSMPALSPGAHSIKVYAINYPIGDSVQLPNTQYVIVELGTVYLDNDTVRVGLNLDWGGVISEIIYEGVNLVNKHDTGRLLQLSLYDGSDIYPGTDGTDPNWGWNPTQAGDKYNHPSSVLFYSASTDSMYTKTQPLEYNPDNKGGGSDQGVLSDVYFEQWTSLEGQAVKVKWKVTHLGTDHHTITVESFPCVYVNRDFCRLFTYEGGNPWSYDSLTEKSVPSSPGSTLVFKSTEYWAAFVDGSGMGLTLYSTTHFPDFAALLFPYFAGTNTFINLPFFDIAPLGTVEVTSWLIAGYYQDTRDIIYSIHSTENPMLTWEFNTEGDREGWIPWCDLSVLEVSDGLLRASATGIDPHMVYWADLGIDAAVYYTVNLRMRVSSGNVASIYFTTLADNEWNGAKVKHFLINSGDNFVTYSMDMRTVGTWQGTISQIRIDPTSEEA
ncbi:MAG: hypothetical protein AMJ91_02385, partial [candidate division Zixibacteria bacterium SM23_73_3]